MKKSGIMTILLSTTMSATAVEYAPYYGVSLSADNVKFDKNVTGIANLASWNASPDIHAGIDIGDYCGFEFGYYQNNSRHKDTFVGTPPNLFLGRTTVGGVDDNDTHRLTYKNSAVRFNVTARYPILPEYNISAIGMLGLAWEKNRVIDSLILDSAVPVNPVTNRHVLYSKTRSLATVTAGAKWQFSESTGLRALVTWQNRTRLLTMKAPDTAGDMMSAPLKNSFRYTLGIYTYV